MSIPVILVLKSHLKQKPQLAEFFLAKFQVFGDGYRSALLLKFGDSSGKEFVTPVSSNKRLRVYTFAPPIQVIVGKDYQCRNCVDAVGY